MSLTGSLVPPRPGRLSPMLVILRRMLGPSLLVLARLMLMIRHLPLSTPVLPQRPVAERALCVVDCYWLYGKN